MEYPLGVIIINYRAIMSERSKLEQVLEFLLTKITNESKELSRSPETVPRNTNVS